MKNINIFCFGFGQVAKNFVKKINSENYNVNLSVTSRNKTSKKIFNGVNYQNYLFDNERYDKKIIPKIKESNYILVSIPPKNGEDLVIKYFSKYIQAPKVKWITYLSATSVYGDHKGKWVNEDSETKPTSSKGIARLKAEKSWLLLDSNKNLPIQIFRLSGIYSKQKNILARLKYEGVKLMNKKDHFFSRIHIDDIGILLFESLSKFKSGEIYNLADDKPSSAEELTMYGAKILNIKDIKKINVDQIENEILKSFYKDSKKVSNKKIKSFFNYTLKFPTYAEGLNNIKDNFI